MVAGNRSWSRAGRKPPPPLTAVQQAKLAGAIAAHQAGDLATATAAYAELLAVAPRCFDALHLLGAAFIQRGQPADGARRIEQALAVDPNRAEAYSNLSRAYVELGRAADAVAACDRALALAPAMAAAWFNRGNALLALGRADDAIASYRQSLSLAPAYPEALNNLGTTLHSQRQYDAAVEALDQAVRLQPGFAAAWNNRGLSLKEQGRLADALASYEEALRIDPNSADALNNLGTALMEQRRHAEAREVFARLVAVAPDYLYAQGNLLHAQLQCCDWSGYEAAVTRVTSGVCERPRTDFPFSFLCVSGSAAAQLSCARSYTADQYPPRTGAIAGGATRRDGRLKVAYVSGDFGAHAVSYLLAEVLEAHDRARIETIGVSWGRHGDGPVRARMERSVEHFIDITGSSDEAVVARLRDLDVDIAVDLTGHTRGNRTGIFARRAAPVQVNFLGLPATMGAAYIDYLIADRFLVPEDRAPHYAESIAWMPDCFQPNDRRRAVPPAVDRTAVGLPAAGTVFCTFNNPAKLNPVMFAAWMEILRNAPDAVLWMVTTGEAVSTNLRREAEARGVAANRLVFAPHTDYAAHLARYACADLFLDSAPFNAGATAADALVMGLPVLTCPGDSFASRMAGSVLTCLGLDELVTSSLGEYVARARGLAAEPRRIEALKATLAARRASHVYFDADRYCRHLESALAQMHSRRLLGHAPESFQVGDMTRRES
jgi:protein O-GlcNAc transferase